VASESPANPFPAIDSPKPLSVKIGTALPIALTALATAFAGMSNGELQKSMFWRSFAAQDQAKATSQWTLAGFKRDRSLICQATADQMRAYSQHAANPFVASPPAGADPRAVEWLAGNGPQPVRLPEVVNEHLRRLLTDIQSRATERELSKKASKVPADDINKTIDDAEKMIEQIDKDWDPTVKAANKLVSESNKDLLTAAQAAVYDMEQRRYRAESTLNQELGYLYDARVKISAAMSEKHERKSQNFFFAMLAAQIGATISALAQARKQKSVLWAIAGGTGVVALLIGGYVYFSDM